MRAFFRMVRDLWDVCCFRPPEWPEVRALRDGHTPEEYGVTPIPHDS